MFLLIDWNNDLTSCANSYIHLHNPVKYLVSNLNENPKPQLQHLHFHPHYQLPYGQPEHHSQEERLP